MGDKDVDAIGTEEATKWDPDLHRAGQEPGRPLDQAVFPRRGARSRRRSVRRRRAVGVQPFRWNVHPRRARLRARVLSQIRLRPSRLHPRALRPLRRTAGRLAAPGRCHRSQSRERRESPAQWRARVGVSRWGLRLVPADLRKHNRLRRQDRIRQNRNRIRSADRADGVHRRAGVAAVPHPRQLAGEAIGSRAASGRDPADHFRVPVRAQRVLPAQPAAADQDRHAGARPDRRASRSSARIPTSTRSTPTSARSCRPRWTSWRASAVSRSSVS